MILHWFHSSSVLCGVWSVQVPSHRIARNPRFLTGTAQFRVSQGVSLSRAFFFFFSFAGGLFFRSLAFSFLILTTCQVGHFDSHLFWSLIELLVLTGGRYIRSKNFFKTFKNYFSHFVWIEKSL